VSWNHAKDSILVGLVAIGVSVLGYMAATISDLNLKVAVILERTERQERLYNDHEDRIRKLEGAN
jgi:hypothetical protein